MLEYNEHGAGAERPAASERLKLYHVESIARFRAIRAFKESGVGRELGAMGLASYMEPQAIKVPVA